MRVTLILLLIVALFIMPVAAQDATIPDISGLNVPQAAATLNRAGFRLGTQSPQPLSPVDSMPAGTVASQSPAAGESASFGTAVDIAIWSAANITLIYDDNDLTMQNRTGGNLNLGNIAFNSQDGAHRFTANRWRAGLEVGDCTQIWSISRREPKSVEGCSESMYWITTNDTSEHFWTQLSGAQSFVVVQDGIQRATCDAAPSGTQDRPVRCEFFVVSSVDSAETTPYIYFAYTTERFTVLNNSEDAWMPLTPNLSNLAGSSFNLGDPALYGNPDIVATTQRLAPNQCLMLTVGTSSSETPMPCDVIAQREVQGNSAFWQAGFTVQTPTADGVSECPAATPNRLTLCILPR